MAIDGNNIETTKTLICQAREPPMITVIDESPIVVTVGFKRSIKYIVSGLLPLQIHIASRVANVLNPKNLVYDGNVIDVESEQTLQILPPTKKQVGTTSFNMSIVDVNGARTDSLDVVCQVVNRPTILLKQKNIKTTKNHPYVVPLIINGYNVQTLQVTSSNVHVLPDSNVVLQQNDDKSYEIHVTGQVKGTTNVEFVVIDGNGASSSKAELQVMVLQPPTIEIKDQRNVVLIIERDSNGQKKNNVRGSNFVEAIVNGFYPIHLHALSSNLDMVNPSLGHLIIQGSGSKRTITVNTPYKSAGTAVIRLVATDGNSASVSVDFQVDIIQEKKKSKHQLWIEEQQKNT